MARKRPDKSWVVKHNPRRDPKFHIALSLAGEGRKTKEPATIFKSGCE